MPLIVPGVCRYTLHAHFGVHPVANVLDYQVDTTGSTVSRSDAIKGLAKVLIDQWYLFVLTSQGPDYVFDSVSWVDLNSATGDVGADTNGVARTLPLAGIQTGASLPSNVAVLVRKNITAARGAATGRMYLCGLGEAQTTAGSPDTLDSAYQATLQTRANTFNNNTTLAGGPTTYSCKMNVVHITAYDPPEPPSTTPKPSAGVGFAVNNLSVQSTLATQRRRLRR